MKFLTCSHLFLVALSLSLLSCAQPEQMDVATVRTAIEAENAKFVEAFNQGDAAGVAALYTDNATLLPPNSEMIQGKQRVQDFWNEGIQMGLQDVSLTTVDVGVSGDTAYEIGRYTVKVQPMMSDSGKYVVVWKRQSDGTWKLHVDIWNSSMPVPGQE